MTLLKYLPERSEYATRVAEAINDYAPELYLVGGAARKLTYGLSANTNGYDFVFNVNEYPDCLIMDLEDAGFKVTGENPYKIDCQSFDMTIRAEPIDWFLLKTPFAGDGMAINCASGRTICTAEFTMLKPTKLVNEVDDQTTEWLTKQTENLQRFEDEMIAAVTKIYGTTEPVGATD